MQCLSTFLSKPISASYARSAWSFLLRHLASPTHWPLHFLATLNDFYDTAWLITIALFSFSYSRICFRTSFHALRCPSSRSASVKHSQRLSYLRPCRTHVLGFYVRFRVYPLPPSSFSSWTNSPCPAFGSQELGTWLLGLVCEKHLIPTQEQRYMLEMRGRRLNESVQQQLANGVCRLSCFLKPISAFYARSAWTLLPHHLFYWCCRHYRSSRFPYDHCTNISYDTWICILHWLDSFLFYRLPPFPLFQTFIFFSGLSGALVSRRGTSFSVSPLFFLLDSDPPYLPFFSSPCYVLSFCPCYCCFCLPFHWH